MGVKSMDIQSPEEAYESKRRKLSRYNGNFNVIANDNDSEYDTDNEITMDDLSEIVAKKDRMIQQLRNKIAHLEQSLKTAEPRGAIINLRMVTVLQEMQDAIVRRLNILINRMDDIRETGSADEELDNEFMNPSKSFLICMSDKLSLLHDYQSTSLHLLESRLSNEIE
jgi:uncharacterized coiled-coil protein SlyX